MHQDDAKICRVDAAGISALDDPLLIEIVHRCYSDVEVRDRAGNLGRNELRDPVVMPQPKVKVLGIGPSR